MDGLWPGGPVDSARISEKHLGHKYDSKQISRIVGRATTELEAWQRRSLQGQPYKFLYIDGANFLVRINGHVSRQSLLWRRSEAFSRSSL
jgi:transposase-like protein